MGQYHYTVNLDKREFLDPHKLGDGLKLVEQSGSGGVNDALHLLLAASAKGGSRGGGDFQSGDEGDIGHDWIGRWAGDRIAVIGDYAEDSDLVQVGPSDLPASKIYNECGESDGKPGAFRDITNDIIPVMEREYELVYGGDGWAERRNLYDFIKGWQGSHGIGDRTAIIDGHEYPISKVLKAAKKYLAKDRLRRGEGTVTIEELGVKPLRAFSDPV